MVAINVQTVLPSQSDNMSRETKERKSVPIRREISGFNVHVLAGFPWLDNTNEEFVMGGGSRKRKLPSEVGRYPALRQDRAKEGRGRGGCKT